MHPTIDISDALTLADACFIDLRSPKEFAEGTIPGAVNIPVFDNTERVEVGTIFKQVGVEDAKTRGLEIASTKLPSITQSIKDVSGSKKAVIFCWRGGMRSRSIATILHLMGIPAYQVIGGYKAYRQYVLQRLQSYKILPRFIVLQGLTGVGKTTLLHELAGRGLSVIDLEGLANHRGSVFGQIGKGQAVTAKNFDAMLLQALDANQQERFIIVEAESKRIGNVYLPECVMDAMRRSMRILVTASIKTRVDRLLEEYLYNETATYADQEFFQCLEMLQSRLGKAKTARLKDLLEQRDYPAFVELLLQEYYDPLYSYSKQEVHFDLQVSSEDFCRAADCITEFLYRGGV